MKDLEKKYGVNVAEFCNNVPKHLNFNRVHASGLEKPTAVLKDKRFLDLMGSMLHPDQEKYVEALLERTDEYVINLEDLRGKLGKHQNVFRENEDQNDITILKRIFNVRT